MFSCSEGFLCCLLLQTSPVGSWITMCRSTTSHILSGGVCGWRSAGLAPRLLLWRRTERGGGEGTSGVLQPGWGGAAPASQAQGNIHRPKHFHHWLPTSPGVRGR